MEKNTTNERRNNIAFFLKSKRVTNGISQKKLAFDCGLCEATIIRMEQGKYWLGLDQYIKICEVLKISTSEAFNY